MTILESIQRDIQAAPTIMPLAMEVEFCQRLMGVEFEDVFNLWPQMRAVIDRLHESHTGAIFEVQSGAEFHAFSAWVTEFARRYPGTTETSELTSLSEMLSTPFFM